MKWIKLTACSLFLFSFFLSISSCEKNAEKKIQTDFSKTDIVLTAANETPVNSSTALGSLNVFYSRETRILTYNFKWSGLTGPVSVFHIHGLAPSGFAASVVQTFDATKIVKCTGNSTTSCGSYSGTLLVDGVVIKEADLLNGLYYVNIHTATNGGGEIRGQIVFQ